MKKCERKTKTIMRTTVLMAVTILTLVAIQFNAFAQDGIEGINEANTKVRSYFTAGTNLMYAVGALLGLIGAVKVYQKWNAGDQDTGKVAAAWFGSCIFLVVVATVIQSFFGV
jgi:protein-S-isoprenylcysteine O-methyltransferase Ste14